MQAWKDKLYPLLKQHLADHVDSATSYLILYHEAAVANLLEVSIILYPAVTSTSSIFADHHTVVDVP